MIFTVIIFASYRPRSYVYPQVNQVTVPSNMYDPQVYNPMLTQDLSISVRYLLTHNKYFCLVKLKLC